MTPTQPPALHDDLRARLLLVAQAIKPIKGLQGLDATVHEAIAALSALPEAGEAVGYVGAHVAEALAAGAHVTTTITKHVAMGDDVAIYTTPQPSNRRNSEILRRKVRELLIAEVSVAHIAKATGKSRRHIKLIVEQERDSCIQQAARGLPE